MEIRECVKARKSIRAFRKDPVPPGVLREIFQLALRAPSWGNTQPWKCTMVGGEILRAMIKEFLEKVSRGEPPRPDIEMPRDWPEELGRRYKENGRDLFKTLGIGREDQEKRNAHRLNMFRFFGAPQAIYFHMDKNLGPYSLFDVGIFAQNIALLATEKGIGTCFLAISVLYPDVVRRHTGIPESDQIVMGMAIGYPDEEAPVNLFRSQRKSLEDFLRWVE